MMDLKRVQNVATLLIAGIVRSRLSSFMLYSDMFFQHVRIGTAPVTLVTQIPDHKANIDSDSLSREIDRDFLFFEIASGRFEPTTPV